MILVTGVTLSLLSCDTGAIFLALICCFSADTECFVFDYDASSHCLSPLREREKEVTWNVCSRRDCTDLHSTLPDGEGDEPRLSSMFRSA